MQSDLASSGWQPVKADVQCDSPLMNLVAAEKAAGGAFVLLDDQRSDRGIFFAEPDEIIVADHASQVASALCRAEEMIASGATLAGYVAYRAGSSFDVLSAQQRLLWGRGAPSLWLARFRRVVQGPVTSNGEAEPYFGAVTPLIQRKDYEAMVNAALEHIRAGDIYQVNLTFPLVLSILDALQCYWARRTFAAAPFGAVVETGRHSILSFSPEKFFGLGDGMIDARPMKGTRPRAADQSLDLAAALELEASGKDRAENLMIVDLLRNDISRICEAGSVSVPALFRIEPYPTVWQMTSSIRGRIRQGETPVSIIRALFPCGSITGAPKIMASRIIASLERWDRGPYTGSIGWLARDAASMNVAIRTVHCARGSSLSRLDVGAGIVAESDPSQEWAECLAKARFAGRVRERPARIHPVSTSA